MKPLTYNSLRFIGVVNEKPLAGPRNVNIHITDKCNLNCIYCWYNYPGSNKLQGKFLRYDVLTKLINDCKKLKVESICVSGEGEPFLHPDIARIIRAIKSSNLNLTILSNGTWPLNVLKTIYLVDKVRINMSAPNRDLYKRIHSVDLFNKVIRNILTVSKLKEKKEIIRPFIEVVFIINRLNYCYISQMVRLVEKIGVNKLLLKFMSPTDYNKRFVLTEKEIPKLKEILSKLINNTTVGNNFKDIYNRISQKDFLKLTTCESREYFSNIADMKEDMKCYIGYYFAQIDLQGDMTLCCINRRFIIGNINEKSFAEIWNSKEAEEFRRKAKYEFDSSKKEWQDCNHCLQWKFLSALNKRVSEYEKKMKKQRNPKIS